MTHLLLLLASLSWTNSSECFVSLIVEAKVDTVDASKFGVIDQRNFSVHLVNRGATTITLVEPGDGSTVGWRTPIVKWQIELDGEERPSAAFKDCGNMNPLQPNEVFELEPGESHALGIWVPPVWTTQTGTYKLRLHYENDPQREWRGLSLGEHDRETMARVRSSTTCVALSNEVTVRVTAIPPEQEN